MLVAAVLRPEEREDRELEVVRIALEQRADSLELSVGETECAMERGFRHAAQGASLAARRGRLSEQRLQARARLGSLERCARTGR